MSGKIKDREDKLTSRVDVLRAELAQQSALVLAAMSGAKLVKDEIQLRMWGKQVKISVPAFVACDVEGQQFDPLTQAMLVYYLHTADGTEPSHEWMAFTELADGRFYTHAFQGYTGNELTKQFGDNMEVFRETAVLLGGTAVHFADVAFRFQILPRVALLVACWLGDDDFLTSYRVLFDTAVNHYLPTDGCAILGNMLTRRLMKSGQVVT
ncbi:MAG: DUF3786 domain-containing protein [Chloroflexi bacterium]|nr:DUF3786 domain-containing protein [Chloroflexota bacterium]